MILLKSIFVSLFFLPRLLLACSPQEVFVRAHEVNSYQRGDGKKVEKYSRSGYCRELPRANYFQDSTSQKFKSIFPRLKKWSVADKAIVTKLMALLPPWLAKYSLKETLRADSDGTANPAASVPFTKTMILYDAFFRSSNQKSILIHEMAHIALWDLEAAQVENFARLSGWIISKGKDSSIERKPPPKVVLADSVESISEDFANHVEVYYSSPEKLRFHNLESFEFIDKLIKQKEKP